jgi:hypothetical protein
VVLRSVDVAGGGVGGEVDGEAVDFQVEAAGGVGEEDQRADGLAGVAAVEPIDPVGDDVAADPQDKNRHGDDEAEGGDGVEQDAREAFHRLEAF